ncbi:MAG: signal peptidase I [Candidatus Aenigmarchaeota archaeon]|nr:signal peptidase I [Candidatus Aenigmarchaeota archaeon]
MIILFGLLICYLLFILFDAFYSSVKLKTIILKPYNRWYFYIIIAFIASISNSVISPLYSSFIRNNIVQAFKIPASSMEPALLVGDHILVSKFNYGIRIPYIGKKFPTFHKPKRGDIIVFIYPVDPKKDFIKRVIATEGEEVQIKNRKLFINGMAIDDPWGVYSPFIPSHFRPKDNYGPTVVPPNSLFVLGDNRDNSRDSRYWGFVDLSAVKGKALFIYFSYHKRATNLLDKVRWNRFGKELR